MSYKAGDKSTNLMSQTFQDFVILYAKDKTNKIWQPCSSLAWSNTTAKHVLPKPEVYTAGLHTRAETKNTFYDKCSAVSCYAFIFSGPPIYNHRTAVCSDGWSLVTLLLWRQRSLFQRRNSHTRLILRSQNSVSLPARAAKQNSRTSVKAKEVQKGLS